MPMRRWTRLHLKGRCVRSDTLAGAHPDSRNVLEAPAVRFPPALFAEAKSTERVEAAAFWNAEADGHLAHMLRTVKLLKATMRLRPPTLAAYSA